MTKNIVKLRIVLWLTLAGVVGWLLYMGVVPNGKISYVYDFIKPNYFIEKLTPLERVEAIQDGRQKIIGNPVYFSLRTPRGFDKVKLTLKYRSESELPMIEAGVLLDKIIWRYDLQPIENRIIDRLALVWDKQEEKGVILLQKEKKYNSLNEFLENLPVRNEVALYNYSLGREFILGDYEAGKAEQSAVPAIRGAYQFYTYVKDEKLDFNFKFLDLNQNDDSDPININLYYMSELIDSWHLDDDLAVGGDMESGDEEEVERELNLIAANLPEGVYKIEVKVNNDIVTKEIKTKQSKLAFINKIWILGGDEEIDLITDSRKLQAQTINPGSLQTIKVRELISSKDYDQKLELDKTYKQFNLKLDSQENTVILEKGDVIIAGDGVFSFSLDSLINPEFKKVAPNLDFNKEGINYILAGYSGPREEGEWKIAQAEFDLAKAYQEFNKYSFIISVPGLDPEDGIDSWVEIDEIKVELEGKSLGEKIKEVFFRNQ